MAKKEATPADAGAPSGGKSKLKLILLIVVGLLLAALYQPLWTEGILRPADFALLLFALLALLAWKTPPWQVVLACAVAGGLIAAAG